jgi:hypothetical protein
VAVGTIRAGREVVENRILIAATVTKGIMVTQSKPGAPRGPERKPLRLRRETPVSVNYWPRRIALTLLAGYAVVQLLTSFGPVASRRSSCVDDIADGPRTHNAGALQP